MLAIFAFCGVAVAVAVVRWLLLFHRRGQEQPVPQELQRPCPWGRQYDVPTYQRRASPRP
jgi:predicted exporter